jgi:monofunctional biosynthetic peptidoglycan transglycosylase
MRAILRLVILAILVPVVYVASAVVYFPAIVWHRYVPPQGSALMEIRGRAAGMQGEGLPIRYEWVPLDRISPHLVRGVLAAEDTRFYEHYGFDLEQIRESWEINQRRRSGPMRGASTITQQTVKNLYLSPSRNFLRKAREAVLTLWMEAWLPKDRIMELYLNIVELGPGVFGAEAAAREYFGGSAGDLSRDQAALLAATLPAPLVRNPGHSTPYLRRRQRMILSRMGRWYEGPSLAEEEAAQGVAPEDTIPGEPMQVESETVPLEEEGGVFEAPADTAPAPEVPEPGEWEPADPAPPAPSAPDTTGGGM